MGRRAVKRVDPQLDLSRHFRAHFDELPNPWNPDELFAQPQPLEIEVGSGKGLFMQTASGEHPEHNFLGIEIAFMYARSAAARLAKLDRGNAVMCCADAQRVFRELVPTASLAAVHVYFPDPWWKKRHRKRRVMNAEFVGQIVRTLQPTVGQLHFWTDVQEYFDVTVELLRDFPQLVGPLGVGEKPAEHELDYRTHFERRMRLSGEAVYRSMYQRTAEVWSPPLVAEVAAEPQACPSPGLAE